MISFAVGVVRIEQALGLKVVSQEGTGVLGLKWLQRRALFELLL